MPVFIACNDQVGKQRRKLILIVTVECEYVKRSQKT